MWFAFRHVSKHSHILIAASTRYDEDQESRLKKIRLESDGKTYGRAFWESLPEVRDTIALQSDVGEQEHRRVDHIEHDPSTGETVVHLGARLPLMVDRRQG